MRKGRRFDRRTLKDGALHHDVVPDPKVFQDQNDRLQTIFRNGCECNQDIQYVNCALHDNPRILLESGNVS